MSDWFSMSALVKAATVFGIREINRLRLFVLIEWAWSDSWSLTFVRARISGIARVFSGIVVFSRIARVSSGIVVFTRIARVFARIVVFTRIARMFARIVVFTRISRISISTGSWNIFRPIANIQFWVKN